MFVRLVDRNMKEGSAININTILYIAEKTSDGRYFLYIETIKEGVYRIYFESEELRHEAFEILLRKKGILNLKGVEHTYYRKQKKL